MSDEQRPAMIEAEGLTKYYGNFAAIEDVSFKVHQGEVVAFLGPNGAGKSTTMKLLTGYLAPSAGVARVAGHDMAQDRLAGSAQLGYLPENGPLYPDMSPRALLEFFADARGMSASYKRERVEAVTDLCALGEVVYKPISKLSKGYRQRVGMAHALLHEPDVLILDEPTAGLDPEERVRFRNLLSDLSGARIVILSTHIVSDVEASATQIALIRQGRLIRCETPEALLRGVRGRVWEWTAPSTELTALRKRYLISSTARHSDGVQVRAVVDAMPAPSAQVVPPRLEDAYLYFVSNGRGGARP